MIKLFCAYIKSITYTKDATTGAVSTKETPGILTTCTARTQSEATRKFKTMAKTIWPEKNENYVKWSRVDVQTHEVPLIDVFVVSASTR